MTIRFEEEVKNRLEQLAKATRRRKSFLAAGAIGEYADNHACRSVRSGQR